MDGGQRRSRCGGSGLTRPPPPKRSEDNGLTRFRTVFTIRIILNPDGDGEASKPQIRTRSHAVHANMRLPSRKLRWVSCLRLRTRPKLPDGAGMIPKRRRDCAAFLASWPARACACAARLRAQHPFLRGEPTCSSLPARAYDCAASLHARRACLHEPAWRLAFLRNEPASAASLVCEPACAMSLPEQRSCLASLPARASASPCQRDEHACAVTPLKGFDSCFPSSTRRGLALSSGLRRGRRSACACASLPAQRPCLRCATSMPTRACLLKPAPARRACLRELACLSLRLRDEPAYASLPACAASLPVPAWQTFLRDCLQKLASD